MKKSIKIFWKRYAKERGREGGIKKVKIHSRRKVKGENGCSINVCRFIRGRNHRKVDGMVQTKR